MHPIHCKGMPYTDPPPISEERRTYFASIRERECAQIILNNCKEREKQAKIKYDKTLKEKT